MSNLPFWIEAMQPWNFINNLPPPQPPITMSDIKKQKQTKKPKTILVHSTQFQVYDLLSYQKIKCCCFFFLVELFRTRLANYSQQRKSRPPTVIFAAHELKIVFHIFKWLYKYLHSITDFAFWVVNTILFIIWLLAKKKVC